MSEHNLKVQKPETQNNIVEEEQLPSTVLAAYEPSPINELAIEESHRQFYRSLEFPCCGSYLEPSLQPILDRKKQLQKDMEDKQRPYEQATRTAQFDGLFENVVMDSLSSNEQIRMKSRFIRDKREEYFLRNSEITLDTEFFNDHLSKLANISFEENNAIKTFQKNAILSERNNQKKNTPFELQINLGCLWVTRHELQNDQQRKFEELRPLLKEFSSLSAYPTLEQIDKQIDFLYKRKERLVEQNAPTEEIEELIKKIELEDNLYKRESDKLGKLLKDIQEKWREIKEIRRTKGMQTVPWQLYFKQYEVNDKVSYDIGVNQVDIKDSISGEGSEAENKRREQIKQQRFLVKIYINGHEVARSNKVHLQWPSFNVPINQKFNVTVYSAPSSIQMEIIKVGLINKTIDVISVGLPGINSKTITAAERRFAGATFALNGYFVRKGEKEPEPPAGQVIYKIEWKGEGSRMPPVSFKSQEEQTAATERTQIQEGFQLDLFDIKDPRVPHKTKKQEVKAEIIKAHGALLPFVNTQSARHLLLKMKVTQPEFEKLEVPLTEEEIRMRQDLIAVIERQKQRTLDQQDTSEEIYNPNEGFFRSRNEPTVKMTKELLLKLQNLKISSNKSSTGGKYKITEEIISEYVFEQMESPIAVFFKNLFTQKRKLGPTITYYLQARNVTESMEISIHMRSARNVPIREVAYGKIKKFRQEEQKMNMVNFPPMMGHNGNMDMLSNYGMGFYQRAPNFNMQGQNFFVPGMINLSPNPMTLEAQYQKQVLERCNTYFEMRFKKLLKRIQCFEGPYPEWNQTLEFNYSLKDEKTTIQKIYANNEKTIKLFLFDMEESTKPVTKISEARIEKRKYYLGRIDIPMSLLVCIPSLTGLFMVERPLVIFGYGINKAGLYGPSQDDRDIESSKTEFPEVLTMVNIDMYTEPLVDNIHAYNDDRKFVTGAESTILLQSASDWLSDLNTKMYIRLWLNNMEGKSIFICRFLGDVAPPPAIEDSVERCARFVSMIPRKYNCKLLENTEEFHMTCEEMLTLKMGQDHGILLCNYFNYIDKRQQRGNISSYLAVGKAFPYGKSIFVLRRNSDTGDCQLWDPYAGMCYFFPATQYQTLCCLFKYSKRDAAENPKDVCNMLEIGCIVTPDNVYVNIQDTMRPNNLDFNITDPKLWKPFLTERSRNEFFNNSIIQSCQPEILHEFYEEPRKMEGEIETSLYNFIKSRIQDERKKHVRPYTFKPNSNVATRIRNNLLNDCELFRFDYRLTGQESSLDTSRFKGQYVEARDRLQTEKSYIKNSIVDSDKTLYGFTLNMPYTTDCDVWERVQETHLHLTETQDVEFVLAVRCYELAHRVYSVWVFLGSITITN